MKLRMIVIPLVAFVAGAGSVYWWVHRPASPAPRSAAPSGQKLWTCPMHPHILRGEPGSCPICKMDLVPAAAGSGPDGHDAYGDATPGGDRPEVRVSSRFLQNFAITTAAAEKGAVLSEFRTVGSLRLNERAIVSVTTKYEGWIETAAVHLLGEPVEQGQLLFEIYSPQLVTTQKEYLASLDYVERLSASASPEVLERARSLAEASRERLRWWDITAGQIDRLARERTVARTIKVFAPSSGLLVERSDNALEGMRVMPGMTVFKIADYSTLWAEVQLYEHQLRHVRPGQSVRITADAYPGRVWAGKIVYLDPSLDPQTRTLKASVEIVNPGAHLRPAMFVNVEVRTPSPVGVRVPREAVLHSGLRSFVIVRKEAGLFQPREVELGVAADGWQEIRRGVAAGEVVVTSSQFLIDSESNLREAINKLTAGGGAGPPSPAGPHVH